MSLIASLPEIDKSSLAVYVMHERSEKHIPMHKHTKGQFSYVDGGIAYVHIKNKILVVPARHYFWIPQGVEHILRVGNSATVLRSLFFYAHDDKKDPFYTTIGIYPINDLLLQMLKYTEKWEGHISYEDSRFKFLETIKCILPENSAKVLPIALPFTENERMRVIIQHIETNIADVHTLLSIGNKFGLSQRSLSRLFKSTLGISFLQYLKLLRMVKALEMILQTDNPLTDIAYAIGYHSLSAFSNTFYQFTRLRPSDFKQYK